MRCACAFRILSSECPVLSIEQKSKKRNFEQTAKKHGLHRACHSPYTENPCYNDSVCYQRFCCKIEFAVMKKLERTHLKVSMSDTFEHFFNKSYVLCIC